MTERVTGLVLMVLSIAWAVRADDSSLDSIRAQRQSDVFTPPDAEERRIARELFSMILKDPGIPLERLRSVASRAKLDLLEIQHGGEAIVVITDRERSLRGSGVFAFRRRGGEPWALQAPHSWRDELTGKLCAQFFLESKAASAAWNSAPRDARLGGAGESADVAHIEESFFNEFTCAHAEAIPQGLVVQLHGFDQEKRTTPAGKSAAAILGSGDGETHPWLMETVQALGKALSEPVRGFPADVTELGGTTNKQAKALRKSPEARFLHVEMSRPLRRRLTSEPKARGLFLASLPRPHIRP